jgi:hypothetical protein
MAKWREDRAAGRPNKFTEELQNARVGTAFKNKRWEKRDGRPWDDD